MLQTTAETYVRRRRAIEATKRAQGSIPVYGPWSVEENDCCRRLHPDYEALQKVLPHRTYSAIKARCKLLGISKRLKPWTAADKHLATRLYGQPDLEALFRAFPGRSRHSIKNFCERIGARRPRRNFVPTGNYLLDALRDRCFQEKLSMPDLDTIASSGSYFQQKGWKSKRGTAGYRHIVNAIHELGGKLTIEWPNEER